MVQLAPYSINDANHGGTHGLVRLAPAQHRDERRVDQRIPDLATLGKVGKPLCDQWSKLTCQFDQTGVFGTDAAAEFLAQASRQRRHLAIGADADGQPALAHHADAVEIAEGDVIDGLGQHTHRSGFLDCRVVDGRVIGGGDQEEGETLGNVT